MIDCIGSSRPLPENSVEEAQGLRKLAAWAHRLGLTKSLRFHGYRREPETGDPTFLFEIDGVGVSQSVRSVSKDVVMLDFSLEGNSSTDCFYRIDQKKLLKIELSEGISSPGGVVKFPKTTEKATITLHLKPTEKTFVRKVKRMTGVDVFKLYCVACHSTDGSKLIGPGFKGFWGQTQTVIRSGKVEKALVDVRESILKLQAAIVKGSEAVPMADFSPVLTNEQVDLLVKYLSDLQSTYTCESVGVTFLSPRRSRWRQSVATTDGEI